MSSTLHNGQGVFIPRDAESLNCAYISDGRPSCNTQIENTKIIQDLRDEIARLREKLATSGRTGGTSKDDVLQMEVNYLLLDLTQSL